MNETMRENPTTSPPRSEGRLRNLRREVHERTFYRQAEGDRRRIEAIRKICRGLKAARLLDVGCGDGSLTEVVAREVAATEVVGVDIAAQVETIGAKGFKALVLDLEEEDIPLPDGYFDIVLCGNVLHHLYNPDHLLHELYRVLSDGGHMVISNRNLGAWYNRIALLFGYQPFLLSPSLEHGGVGKLLTGSEHGAGGHTGGFTMRAFKRLLELHDFSILRVTGAANTPPPEYAARWLRIANTVGNALFCPFTSLAAFTIVLAKKRPPAGRGA